MNIEKFNPCFFQWLYFAKATSVLDNLSVNEFRRALGKELARIEPLKEKVNNDFVVVPVPSTSIPAAQAMAEELGISYEEVLIKNSQSGRTFIVKSDRRDIMMDVKFDSIPGRTEGKKIFLVDDSIVRGNTCKKIVNYVKETLKPSEIHLRITSPPIRYPCFYGVDFPTQNELVASYFEDDEILEKELTKLYGVNSLKYMPFNNLIKVFNSFGFAKDKLCLACLNGEYPTEGGRKRYELSKAISLKT